MTIARTALLFVFGLTVTAQSHEHGKAELDIAIEGVLLKAELHSPAESTFGFEHAPKTDREKRTVSAALDVLRTKGAELIIVPPEFGCKFLPSKAEVVKEGAGHQNVEASFEAKCQKKITKGTLRFGFSKHFPRIEQLVVQVVGAGFQTGATVKSDKDVVKLGPQ